MSAFTRTYSTTLSLPTEAGCALSDYAALFSRAVRTCYAAQERDHAAAHLSESSVATQAERKAALCQDFGLTSRQAYSALTEAQGHRDSILALNKLELYEIQDRLTKHQGRVARGQKRLAEHKRGKVLRLGKAKAQQLRETVFIAQTKVARLRARLKALKADVKAKRTSLTFGTKKALRQRNALELALKDAFIQSNAALVGALSADLDAWQAAWNLKRQGQFLVVGSKDESGGCQGCIATAQADGSFTLSVKLPPGLGGHRVLVKDVRFKYGDKELRYALAQQTLRAASTRTLLAQARTEANKAEASKAAETPTAAVALDASGKKLKLKLKPNLKVKVSQKAVEGGVALTWRFMRQPDGRWTLSFTTAVAVKPITTDRTKGAIGVDLNAGFLTVAETDACGNILSSIKLATPDVGLSANQRQARQAEAVKLVIALCVKTGKPLVLEALDFTRKKRDLALRSPGAKRKLSALAYSAIHDLFCARALDHGVEVVTIDPAYTSTQGWVRYATPRGWSVHQAAAGVIARRGQGYFEKAPVSGTLCVLVEGLAVERQIPAEIGRSDADLRWPALHRILQQAIASHYRVRRRAGQPHAARPAGAAAVSGEIPELKRGSPSPGMA